MHEGRYELKYALPISRREEVLAAAGDHVVPDPKGRPLDDELPGLRGHAGAPLSGYAVHSLYFDDHTLDGYAQRLDDLPIRNRIRIRTYGRTGGPAAPVFLEAKRKLRKLVVKHRIVICNTVQWAEFDPDQPWRDAVAHCRAPSQRLARRWLSVVESGQMNAVCRVGYVREVFTAGTARLTLDHHVGAEHIRDPRHIRGPYPQALLPPNWFVLELKFNGREPAWMRSLVRRLRLTSEPVSKFALGVALTVRSDHPDDIRRFTPPSVRRSQRAEASR